MLDLLNLMYLGVLMVGNITLYSDEQYPVHVLAEDRESVTLVSHHREWWRDDGNGKCKFTGVMVPYVRDWEEVTKTREHETILPPEPDKTAGQALIFNKKVCEGKPTENILRVATVIGVTYYRKKYIIHADDVHGMKVEDRPKWFDQVFKRIERVAEHDADAKAFLADVTAAAQEAKAQSQAQLQKDETAKP